MRGNRLSKIVTKTGDDGTTGLADGTRCAKDDARIEALGTIDELNSHLGVLLAENLPNEIAEILIRIQHDLFDLGGELSIPGATRLSEEKIAYLENHINPLNAALSPLKEFILPGGSRPAALCHVARTIVRRAERRLVTLRRLNKVSDVSLKYLNRLSDLLFVMSRTINRLMQQDDVLWQPANKSSRP